MPTYIQNACTLLFSKPSWEKALTLLLGTLVCTGKRTVCAALRAMGLEHIAGFAKYHHLLNRNKWSTLEAAKILFLMLLALIPEGHPIDISPEKVFGKKERSPRKGQKLINFKQMLPMEDLPWKTTEIMGYGGIKRTVRFITCTCLWGADGVVPVPIRWVLAVDPTGNLDPLPLMSTDENITSEMAEWMEKMLRSMLQAA